MLTPSQEIEIMGQKVFLEYFLKSIAVFKILSLLSYHIEVCTLKSHESYINMLTHIFSLEKCWCVCNEYVAFLAFFVLLCLCEIRRQEIKQS